MFLTVLTVNKKHVAIVDWVDLSRMSVFILPSYVLNDYLTSLIKRGWSVVLSFEDEVEKRKRRFGFNFSCLRNVFKEEWEELKELKGSTKDKGKEGDEK